MEKSRLEAFSDGVIAIIITIMVLELKAPHGGDFASLRPLILPFFGYLLSFVYVGIYWNNHHHLFMASKKVNGAILWANLHLLFWLSLFPFVTDWVGESHLAALPTAAYGAVLFLAAVAYRILQSALIRNEGNDSLIANVLGHDFKTWISPFCYFAGMGLAFVSPWISVVCYVSVAMLWLIPDRRIERKVEQTVDASE